MQARRLRSPFKARADRPNAALDGDQCAWAMVGARRLHPFVL
jgi:hypothetical protein